MDRENEADADVLAADINDSGNAVALVSVEIPTGEEAAPSDAVTIARIEADKEITIAAIHADANTAQAEIHADIVSTQVEEENTWQREAQSLRAELPLLVAEAVTAALAAREPVTQSLEDQAPLIPIVSEAEEPEAALETLPELNLTPQSTPDLTSESQTALGQSGADEKPTAAETPRQGRKRRRLI